MSKHKMNIQYPLIWMVILLQFLFVSGCDYYEDQSYKLSDIEQAICDRFSDTLNHPLEAVDLRLFGPAWTGAKFDVTVGEENRIGSTWHDDDFVLEPDVFVFINGSDTLAAMQFINFLYHETTEQVDSIQIAYIYNPTGLRSFAGLIADTLLIPDTHANTFYLDFSQGSVSADADWNISIEGAIVLQSATGKVHRIEDTALAVVTSAPLKNYVADISGYEVAYNFLVADTAYLTETDSLLALTLVSEDAGYLLWDRQGSGSGSIVFNASDYMTIALWDETGIRMMPTDESISMQAIAYCPNLNTSAVYDLSEETYLIQFLPHEQMVEQSFSLVIMEDE
ncbi:hypothetical protein HQ531_00635 [bacterium]|nr:hypothetical protein [bacterium]